jgi:hypothetical protein
LAYRIEGLSSEPFRPLFAMSDAELAGLSARRVIAGAEGGYPCRVSLRDADPGERLILVNHVSNDAPTPFRASHAIYVREGAQTPPACEDRVPDYLDRRTLSLRGFDCAGMLHSALLAAPGEADARIRDLLAADEVATIHAHNAAFGCFLARIERN